MLRLLMGLGLLLSACCAAPQATSSVPTAFVTDVVSVETDYVLGRIEGQAKPVRLGLTGSGTGSDLAQVGQGSRLYVQGELDAQGWVTVSSFQILNN